MNPETLTLLKASLPSGYEKKIAREVGCSVGTVHNIMNGKHTSRSIYQQQILEIALRLAEERRVIQEQTQQKAEALQNEIRQQPEV